MYKPSAKQNKELKNLEKLDPRMEVKWDEKKGVPLRVRGWLSKAIQGEPVDIAISFLVKHKDLFVLESPEEEMRYKTLGVDRKSNLHVRFQQMYKNLPVFGRELVVHIDKDGVVRGINGKLAPGIKLPDKTRITAQKAVEAVLKDDANNRRDRIQREPTLLVYVGGDDKPYLAWHVTVEGMDKALDGSPTPAKWEYFVDSQTGKIIWRYNNEQTHTSTTGAGTGKYSGAVTLNTTHDHGSGNYLLEDGATGSTARVITHDANNGWPPADVSQDADNNWNAADQGPEVDCHLYTRMVFDYYFTMHGRNSYDDAGADMHIYAHCGTNWKNASWNGDYVKVGDGDGVEKDNYCALDVIAHEWTHAVVEYTAGLIYSDQSGALNESLCDVFAALVDGDWLHGEDYWLKTTAPSSRNLEDPTNGGQYDPANPIASVLDGHQPDHMDDIYTGGEDWGGVHINSGIMNKAAYLIATGGNHRGITICEGLGRDVLGNLYYQALTNHLISSSDFADMRDAVLDSLDDLYTGDARYDRWRASIINALAAVGIGTAVSCPATCWIAPRICPPSPDIHVLCPPSPRFVCPPSPHIICPPSPEMHLCPPSPYFVCPPSPRFACPPAPHGCLPGPDPLPFKPESWVRQPETRIPDILKVPGIGEERAALLKSKGILTVRDFIIATSTPNKLKALAASLGISEKVLSNWRLKAEALLG
jgi:bacillolysin